MSISPRERGLLTVVFENGKLQVRLLQINDTEIGAPCKKCKDFLNEWKWEFVWRQLFVEESWINANASFGPIAFKILLGDHKKRVVILTTHRSVGDFTVFDPFIDLVIGSFLKRMGNLVLTSVNWGLVAGVEAYNSLRDRAERVG